MTIAVTMYAQNYDHNQLFRTFCLLNSAKAGKEKKKTTKADVSIFSYQQIKSKCCIKHDTFGIKRKSLSGNDIVEAFAPVQRTLELDIEVNETL